MPLFDVAHRPASVLNGVQKVEHVPARSGGSVNFHAFFSNVLGILFPFVEGVEVDLFGVAVYGNEIGFTNVSDQGALFSVNGERPGVIRIAGRTPTPVFPVAVEFVVFEDGGLSIGGGPCFPFVRKCLPRR